MLSVRIAAASARLRPSRRVINPGVEKFRRTESWTAAGIEPLLWFCASLGGKVALGPYLTFFLVTIVAPLYGVDSVAVLCFTLCQSGIHRTCIDERSDLFFDKNALLQAPLGFVFTRSNVFMMTLVCVPFYRCKASGPQLPTLRLFVG